MNKVIAIVFTLVIYSCSTKQEPSSPSGKWAGIHDNEYVELHIDSTVVNVYSLWHRVPRRSIRYKMHDDSLLYYDYGYSVGYKKLSDSIIILSTAESIDTLYRMNDAIITFDEVDENDSIALKTFYELVYARGMKMYSEKGMEFEIVEEAEDTIFDFEMEIN